MLVRNLMFNRFIKKKKLHGDRQQEVNCVIHYAVYFHVTVGLDVYVDVG